MKRTLLAVACVAAFFLMGCAAPRGVGEYFGDRGRDFADCWRFSLGYGLGVHARARAVIAEAGEGFSYSRDFGWDGPAGVDAFHWRRLASSITVPILFEYDVDVREFDADTPWLPFLRIRLADRSAPTDLPSAGVADLSSTAILVGYHHKTHARTLPPWSRTADLFWIQADATAVVPSVRFGLNPLELLDWLCGLGCVDILGDDHFVADRPGVAEILAAARDGDDAAVAALLAETPRLAYAHDAELRTPLHYAAQAGHLAVVERLMKANADPRALDRDRQTPIDFATDEGNPDLAQRLERGE